jgi:outer membrane lipoprotein-sorting protein
VHSRLLLVTLATLVSGCSPSSASQMQQDAADPPVAQLARDPTSILSRVRQTYRELQRYYFESETEFRDPDGPSQIVGETLAGAGSQLRWEYEIRGQPVVQISDGTTRWTYFPETMEYLTFPVESPLAAAVPLLNVEFLSSYAELGEFLAADPEWLREESLLLQGRSVSCDVVRVDKREGVPAFPDPEADRLWRGEWTGVPTTYWIDGDGRVLKSSTTSKKGKMQIKTYSRAQVGGHLPPSLFTFTPPDGAVDVTEAVREQLLQRQFPTQ